jgi:hypothetical protein
MSFLGGLGSVFGALGSLLPGYVQGERQAVQDNWSDLNNYNKVQAGQGQNAFDFASFGHKLDMVKDAADLQNYNTQNAGMTLQRNRAWLPYMVEQGQWFSKNGNWLFPLQTQMSLLGAMGIPSGGQMKMPQLPSGQPMQMPSGI